MVAGLAHSSSAHRPAQARPPRPRVNLPVLMQIQLPDNSLHDVSDDATAYDVATKIGPKLAEAALAARVHDQLFDLHRPLRQCPGFTPDAPTPVAIITTARPDKKGRSRFRDDQHQTDALYLLRHSAAHVMAEAIQRLYPDARLAYGPPLDTGFYYDLQLDTPISSDDFEKIEAEMKTIVKENRPFTRYELNVETGMSKLSAEGNKYKVDNAAKATTNGANTLSWYVTDQAKGFDAWTCDPLSAAPEITAWEDLCQGPHIDRTGRIGAFKVTSVARSHWHGDITSDAFQRVYGTAFFTQEDLDAHVKQLEEAKARDHRVIGKQLGLFEIDEMVGQGLVLWKPKGAVVRDQLQKFISEHLDRQGYRQVFTPHIGKLDLYRTSGHFPYYSDSQYPPLIDRETIQKLADEGCTCSDLAAAMTGGDIDGYLLKPMNCPHHIRIFASDKHSYRDLPVRLAEFGTVYRWEQSGELGGMTRVRGFTQDDAHLFVTPDQLAHEVLGCIELVKIVFKTLGMDDYRVRVGLRDPDSSKFVGEASDWDQAESACLAAAESLGVPFSQEPGEAAFYGPKIDFVVKDVIGREWQLGTVQVDYQLPQRFGLSYVGSDNAEHVPVMIHRAPFGSMERFIGCLIEHFNGSFPLWLSPEQVRVLPVSDKFADYAASVHQRLRDAGLRAEIDTSSDRLGAKIGRAESAKVPYMLVVGGKDEQAGTVSVRHHDAGDLGAMPIDTFIEQVVTERTERALHRTAAAAP